MEQEPNFGGYEKDLPKPETSVDKDDSKKTEKKERAALLTKRTFEGERRREEEPKAKRAGEQLLGVVQKDEKKSGSEEKAAVEVPDQQITEMTSDVPEAADVEDYEYDGEEAFAGDQSPEPPAEAEPDEEEAPEDDPAVSVPVLPTRATARPTPPPPPPSRPGNTTGNTPPPTGNTPPPPGRPPTPPGPNPNNPQNPNHPLNPNNQQWNAPQGPNGPNFNQQPPTPNVQPNPNAITEDDLHAAEKRGLRKGVATGSVVAWGLTRHSQGKKREAMAKTLNAEIDKRDNHISQLEIEKMEAAKKPPHEVIKEVAVPAAEAPEPVIGRIASVGEKAPDAPAKIEHFEPVSARAAEAVPGTVRLGETGRVEVAPSTVTPEAKPAPTEQSPGAVPDSVASYETPKKVETAAIATSEQPTATVSPEMEKQYREDAAEKLDRPQDQGGITGGGAAAVPADDPAIHAHSHSIGPAIAHDPVARSVSQARKDAQSKASHAKMRGRLELGFALGIVLMIILVALARVFLK